MTPGDPNKTLCDIIDKRERILLLRLIIAFLLGTFVLTMGLTTSNSGLSINVGLVLIQVGSLFFWIKSSTYMSKTKVYNSFLKELEQ